MTESLASVLSSTENVSEDPSAQRDRRLARAVQHELSELRREFSETTQRIEALEAAYREVRPLAKAVRHEFDEVHAAMSALKREYRDVRPLAETEREEIEFAVQRLGARLAAKRLGIAIATVYRRLEQYRAAEQRKNETAPA